MKLKVATWRITWRFLLAFLFVFIAIIGMGSTLFFGVVDGKLVFLPWGVGQILLLTVFFAFSLASYIIALTSYYYTIENSYFTMRRFGKTYEFEYKNIEFIDIAESERKGMVIFYTPRGRTKYLLGDKDGVLLKTLIKKCPKILTVEEFKAKHPEENY